MNEWGEAPRAGDIVWLDFDPQTGHEQAGRRPALVLSPYTYNRSVRLGVVCPITSRIKGYPFEVPLPPGLPVEGAVLADQVKSLDLFARNAVVAGSAPEDVVRLVLTNVLALFGLRLQ